MNDYILKMWNNQTEIKALSKVRTQFSSPSIHFDRQYYYNICFYSNLVFGLKDDEKQHRTADNQCNICTTCELVSFKHHYYLVRHWTCICLFSKGDFNQRQLRKCSNSFIQLFYTAAHSNRITLLYIDNCNFHIWNYQISAAFVQQSIYTCISLMSY